MTAAIEAAGLHKSYGGRVGIAQLELAVPRGSVYGFLGPNGAGKSTTIRLLMGLLRPDAGRALVLGHDCWRQSPEVKRRVGYLPGDLQLYGWLSGHEALRIAGGVRGLDLTERGQELAGQLDLDLGVSVRQQSRGMRQKLGLILALAHEPEVLILDEPTTALDPITQGTLYGCLRACAARGTTVFFSSHVLSEVEALCDRVAILRRGRVVAEDRLDALRRRAGRRVTVRWNGRPPEPPPLLELAVRHDSVWQGELRGTPAELVAWLQGRPLADLEIGPPDLETLFLRYYHEEPS